MAKRIGNVSQRNEEDEHVIEWKIPSFFGLSVKVNKVYLSPSFPFANAYWYLGVYTNGEIADKSEGYINLYLYRESSGPPISLEYILGLKTVLEGTDPLNKFTYIFQESKGYGSSYFLKRSKLLERQSELAPRNALTVVCALKYPTLFQTAGLEKKEKTKCTYCKTTLDADEDVSSHLCTEFLIKCPKCGDVVPSKNCFDHRCQAAGANATEKLLSDFKSLMLSGDDSDAIIRVQEEEFRLHRSVLTSRSPYFQSMFNCSMKEKNTGIVPIDDCEPDVFRSFVHFLYTSKLDKLTLENVCNLYELADKYQEDQLKVVCLDFMRSTLSVKSFCDFTVLAFRHDVKELLENSINFFASNMKEIIRSVKWQTLLAKYPTQANELFIKALN